MNDKIINITFPKCGTCLYAQKFDAKDSADCFGHPPSVHIIGATKDVLGRPGLQLETFVPRVHKDRCACALHKRKEDFATAGSS
jgi:hypothetical protein